MKKLTNEEMYAMIKKMDNERLLNTYNELKHYPNLSESYNSLLKNWRMKDWFEAINTEISFRSIA